MFFKEITVDCKKMNYFNIQFIWFFIEKNINSTSNQEL